MSVTNAAAGLTPQQWDDQFFTSYVRSNQFTQYMGKSEMSLIQVKEDLTKKPGDSLTYALVNNLTGAGKTNRETLEGYEEALNSRSFKLTPTLMRHAVAVMGYDEQLSAIDLREAARAQLKTWLLNKDRNDVLTALGSINGTAYASATEAQKDGWLDDNYDRVLFGAAVSNTDSTGGTVAYDFSDSLGAVDNSADKLTYSVVELAKRRAKIASPAIRPIQVDKKGEWFVLFCATPAFRDLKASLSTIHQNAEVRGRDNPLFQDGDLVWDGVIIREIPEISTVSNGSIACAPSFLCGAQALAWGWTARPRTIADNRDYQEVNGIAVRQFRGIEKMKFGKGSSDTADLVDHGVFTVWTAGVADA